MNLIVAVDSNWAIGKENKLLVSIPQDMKFFRETTKGKVVAMGRKTLESFPGGQPLKNRVNVVLTTDKNYKVKDTVIVHTIEEMLDELKKYDSEDIFVIGGESIYRQLLPYCTKAYITKIDHAYDADTYFPNLDEDPEWEMTKISEEQTYFDGLQGYLIESRHPDFSEYDWSDLIYAFELLLEDTLCLHAPEMLTSQPKLWEALFSSISAFEFDTQRRIAAIDIGQLSFTQLSAINSLLKTPIFEIRALSLQQLQEIYSA